MLDTFALFFLIHTTSLFLHTIKVYGINRDAKGHSVLKKKFDNEIILLKGKSKL